MSASGGNSHVSGRVTCMFRDIGRSGEEGVDLISPRHGMAQLGVPPRIRSSSSSTSLAVVDVLRPRLVDVHRVLLPAPLQDERILCVTILHPPAVSRPSPSFTMVPISSLPYRRLFCHLRASAIASGFRPRPIFLHLINTPRRAYSHPGTRLHWRMSIGAATSLSSHRTASPRTHIIHYPRTIRAHRRRGSDELPAFASPTSPTFSVPRLPTPPPPKHHRSVPREDTIMPAMDAEMHDEPTPRPAPREPALLKFERSLLLARQTETVEVEEVQEEEEEEGGRAGGDEGGEHYLVAAFNGARCVAGCARGATSHLAACARVHAWSSGSCDERSWDANSNTDERPFVRCVSPLWHRFSPDRALLLAYGSAVSPIISLAPISSSPPSGSMLDSHFLDLPDLSSALNSNTIISRSSSTLSSSTSGAFPSPVYRATALGPSVSTSSSSQSISRSSSYSSRNDSGPAPQLRLVRPLGHGAFSAVWACGRSEPSATRASFEEERARSKEES